MNELHDPGTYASGIGCRVVRGPDWKWSKQDGGEGHVGSVRRFDTAGEAIVVWDSGIVANYRCGTLGFDLRVLDSAPTGVKHPGTICEGCHESPIYGIRWKCVVCLSADLCSSCYHGDKHSLAHQFLRITGPYKTRVIVGRRIKQRRVEAQGLFPKARVVRGIDWSWDSQDCVSPLTSTGSGSLLVGGSGSGLGCRGVMRQNGEQITAGPILLPTQGRITDRRDWYPWAPRSAALVAWDSGAYNVYRVGYAGLIDLKAIRPAKGGSYYVDHLPLLADLRGYTNDEVPRGVEEITGAAGDDDVADLCRDSNGNPLVPNWTNLQDLEARRRQATACNQESRIRQPGITPTAGRENSRERNYCCSSATGGGQSNPGLTSSQEPAASSCLNVCSLASRLQIQSDTIESQPGVGTARRPQLHNSRPAQMTREPEMEEMPPPRAANQASGGLRTIGQTARNILTDLLRPNSSAFTGSVARNVTTSSSSHSRPQGGTRSAVASPPPVRTRSQLGRQEERTSRTGGGTAVTIPRPNQSQGQQRREVNMDSRNRILTLLPRPVVSRVDSTSSERATSDSGATNRLEAMGGRAETGPSDVGFAASSSLRPPTVQQRREQAPTLVYGVYNHLHGIVSEQAATDSAGCNSASENESGDAERRVYQHGREQLPPASQTNEDLIRAAGEGNIKRLKCLLQHRRANVNVRFAGATALHVACQAGHFACVAILLQFGAKRQIRDGSGNEAVHAAAQGGNANILRLLLTPRSRQPAGAVPISSVQQNTGESSGAGAETEESSRAGDEQMVMETDDIPDINSRNALRQTPLHLAVSRHDFLVAQCLLEELNALPNLQDCDGDTPLHDAIAGQNIRLVELLLEHNADLTITNNSGQNPLHYATVLGEPTIARAVFQHCLQTPWLIDEPQPDGLTALHLASLHGHLEVADLLLQSGADPNLAIHRPAGLLAPRGGGGCDEGGVNASFTPLHLAVHKAHPDVVCLLLCYGARATTHSGEGRSPMQLALTTLAQTHDIQHAGHVPRRFDVALVPFLASVARLLIRMADSLPAPTSGVVGLTPLRQRASRGESEEQLIEIEDNNNSPQDEDGQDLTAESTNLISPSPLCRRLKSTVQATLDTGVPRLVLIAACLASAIGAESWVPNSSTDDDEANVREVEVTTENFVTDIFSECLDPVLQLALQQCHMEAMNSISQIRSQALGSLDVDNRSPRHTSGGASGLLVNMEGDEENLVDTLFQADSQVQSSAISLMPSRSPAVNQSGASADEYLIETEMGNANNTRTALSSLPITIANQLTPQMNNACSRDSQAHLRRSPRRRVLPPALDEIDLEWRECLVCSESDRSTILSPCGHIITCANCTPLIKKCLLCRQRVTGFQKFSSCCECGQSTGVILARPCNHLLWCKSCLKAKVVQLDCVSNTQPIANFNNQTVPPVGATFPSNAQGDVTAEQVATALPAGAAALDSENSSEWRQVSLSKLLSMVDIVSNLLDDLIAGGLCIDGCPVCNGPVEAVWPVIVSCAGVEHQSGIAFVRDTELTEVLGQQAMSTPAEIPTQTLPNVGVNRTSVPPSMYSHTENSPDLLHPANFSSAIPVASVSRHESHTLEMSVQAPRRPLTPNNQIHQNPTGRVDVLTRPRSSRTERGNERELSKLKHELQVMREQIRCPICLDRSRNLVFMCGHATCQWCGDQVTACPICRRTVESRIILY